MTGRPVSRPDARTPVRTCIGCRGRGGRSDLVRVVVVEGVVVPDYQLSLAIGKEGQNARLAARLTGWRIDIRSDEEPTEVPVAPAR